MLEQISASQRMKANHNTGQRLLKLKWLEQISASQRMKANHNINATALPSGVLEQISASQRMKANHNRQWSNPFISYVGTNISKSKNESKSQLNIPIAILPSSWNKYQQVKE